MRKFSFFSTSHHTLRNWKWGVAPLFFLFLAFAPLTPPIPGLNNAVAIDKFLNNNLPAITPWNGGAITWGVKPAFPNLTFEDPLVITMHPQQDTMFVASRQGLIEYFEKDPSVSNKTTLLDLSGETAVVWDGGFLGLQFHPEFGQAGSPNRNYFYVFYCGKGPNGEAGPANPIAFTCENNPTYEGAYMLLERYEVQDGTLNVVANSVQTMIKLRLYNSTHRGGGLAFGNDGYLYLTLGEQARYTTSQNIFSNFEGGVIRIDVDSDGNTGHAPIRKMGVQTGNADEFTGVGYFIPNDNPWQDATGGLFEEFWAIGSRNPHRMTLDAQTGDLWIGEIGGGQREEINVLEKGANYGWPKYEGMLQGTTGACGSNTMTLGPGTLTSPVVDFLRTESNCIIGGYVYRGTNYPTLDGAYLCGGYSQNRIFAIEKEVNGTYTKTVLANFTPGGLITFGQDHEGEIYMGRQSNSTTLYTLDGQGAGPPAPQFLSQTGAFSDLTTLTPTPGVIPYDMIEPFWSDGADKFRWLAIPNNGTHDTPAEQIKFSEEGNWEFPAGAVLIKHFELGGQRVETRFEVLGDDGKYYYLTYKWNAAGTDAELLYGGEDKTYTVGGQNQIWHFPGRDECLSCHQQAAGSVLGAKTRHLNKSIVYPNTGLSGNQLVSLSHIGAIDANISDQDAAGFLTVSAKNDGTASLEDKARSYLDVNCSYCHQPGTGNRANFDARLSTPLFQQNLINGAVIDPLGVVDGRVVVPQQVGKSILHNRINSLQTGIAMPPIAKSIVDAAGEQLIVDWINSLSNIPTNTLTPVGDASLLPGGCYELTENQGNEVGATWYNDPIDFTQDTRITFSISLGSNDAGADGVAVLFHTEGANLAPAAAGGGFGAGGITPSLGIEFDTYNNGGNDIGSDHIAIWKNGDLNQALATAVCASPLCANIEDGNTHQVEILWEAVPQRLTVYFGGNERIQYQGDIIQTIFGGNNWLYVGLTGATGGATNQQLVCNLNLLGTTPPPPVTPNGGGLSGTYFNNMDLTAPVFTRIDPAINFDWGTGSPDPGIDDNTFSVRWEGGIVAPYPQLYTFTTQTDDGVRLWVDGQLLIDQWVNQAPTDHSASIFLPAGQLVPIKMEYFENTGGAVAQLNWSGPLTAAAAVPVGNLFPVGTTFPVEWLSLTAQRENQGAMIKWSTATEIDNDFFSVERSADGRRFVTYAKVPSRGNSAEVQSYTSYDANPIPGMSYYRIRQTDLNGQFSYSPAIALVFEGFQPEVRVYPNPIARNMELQIQMKVPKAETLRLDFYNIQGQQIHSLQVELSERQERTQVPIDFLASGMYLVRIFGESWMSSHRIEVRE